MIKIENISFSGYESAIRGMRNPYDSWEKSDSFENKTEDLTNASGEHYNVGDFIIGQADQELCQKLIRGGSEHRKFLRMIPVWMDMTAPLYWWKEFDTYKIGTVTNSCSTMHTIHKKEFTVDDFSHEHLECIFSLPALENIIFTLNHYRQKFLEDGDKRWWWQMIQLLPSSYNQKRTVMMNYETALRIIQQRKNHKLDEWVSFVKVLSKLPFMDVFSA